MNDVVKLEDVRARKNESADSTQPPVSPALSTVEEGDGATICQAPEGRCADPVYRLAVYEAGHALVAHAIGQKILYIRMLPRPPITLTDKAFVNKSWDSFYSVLENRVIELFGGHIAEQIACSSTTCCTGDVSRIDELTRILAGLDGVADHEEIFFELEQVAKDIFADPNYEKAIYPLSEYLYEREMAGDLKIDGAAVEQLIARYIPKPVSSLQKKVSSFLGMIGGF